MVQKKESTKTSNKKSGGILKPRTSLIVREFSAGGVVCKKTNNSIFWLVARSKPSKEYPMDVWRLPKGWIDDRKDGKSPGPISSGEIKATETDLQEAAIREVKEEGGVEAKIIEKLGSEMYVINSKSRKQKVLKFVTFYLMEFTSETPEGFGFETSEVKWLPYEEARKIITYSGEKKIMDKANKILSLGRQVTLV